MRWRGRKRISDGEDARFIVIRVTDLRAEEARAAQQIDPNEAAKFLLLPEEVAFFQTHFPGVKLSDLADKR